MERVGKRKRLSQFYDKTIVYLSYVSAVLLALITLSVTAEILVRKLAGTSLPWVIECSEHALAFITFLAAAWVLKEEAHIKVDIVLTALNDRMRALLNVMNSLLGAALCLFLAYRSGLTILDLWKRHIYTITTLEIPMAPLYSVIFIGSLLLSIQFSIRTKKFFSEWRNDRNIPEKEPTRVS
ncbi:MAG: TRAP transporter small permease [Pseudomonadota bacterium]